MDKTKQAIVIITGKSGVGKTTLMTYLEQVTGLHKMMLVTTRSPRNADDREYEFVDESTFQSYDERGLLIEKTRKYDVSYGLKKPVHGSNVVVLDLEGTRQVLAYCTSFQIDIACIFLDAPEEQCIERMQKRGDTAHSITQRLNFDKEHFTAHNLQEIENMTKLYHLDASGTMEEVRNKIHQLIPGMLGGEQEV